MIVEIGLSSGQIISVGRMMLYPSKLVEQAVALKAQAMAKMGNFSSGIGFIGSPGWAIAGSLLVGALEGAVNSKNNHEGASLLRKASDIAEEAKARGVLVDVNNIANVFHPSPSLWHANHLFEETVSFEGLREYEIDKLCERHNFKRSEIYKRGIFSDLELLQKSKNSQWSDNLIHNGEEFVIVETNGRIVHIKWECVNFYSAS